MSVAEASTRLVSETRNYPLPRAGSLLFRGGCPNDIVSLVIAAPMGSREEPPEKAGLSTLALRMLSRGRGLRHDLLRRARHRRPDRHGPPGRPPGGARARFGGLGGLRPLRDL